MADPAPAPEKGIIERLYDLPIIGTVLRDMKLHSMKLAAAVSAALGLLVEHSQVIAAFIAIIPRDGLVRTLFIGGVVAMAYGTIRTARMWPQPSVEAEDVTK